MASVIIAKNQTAAALPLEELPVPNNSLPASPATVTLTDYATVSEIQNDPQLNGYVAVSDVILNVDGTDLSATEGSNALSTVVSPSTTTITTETSTAGGASNAGKVLELDANGKADGLVAGDAVSHLASTSNPHSVTAAQAGASALGHTHVEADITDLTHTDANAIHDNVAGEIAALTTPTGGVATGDLVLIEDVSNANSKQKTTLGDLLDLVDMLKFDGYDAAGGTTLGAVGVWTDIPLDTERQKDSIFTHTASSAEVTITQTGTYLIMGRVTSEVASGTTRTQCEMRIVVDTGGGYALLPGTLAEMYAREVKEGEATGTAFAVVDVTAGDKFKLQAKVDSGTNTVQTHYDGSSLIILNLRGQKGDKGDTGSGSNISLQEDGVSVTNTPHSTLNFVSPLTATDNGDGSADIAFSNSAVFGSEYQKAESLGESSTTSDTLQQKLRLTTTTVPAGDYYVSWSCGMYSDDKNCALRVQVDDSTDLFDSGDFESDTDFHPLSGNAVVTLTNASHTIDLDYAQGSSAGTGSAYIKYARITMWRVA